MIVSHYVIPSLVQCSTRWGVVYGTHLWHSKLTPLIHRTAYNWHYH